MAVAGTAQAALDINGIYMTSCMDHLDGTPSTNPWVFEVWVELDDPGDLDHIDVTLPGGGGVSSFTLNGGDWEYESPSDYLSLAALQGDYPTGDYTFDFRDSGNIQLNLVTLGYTGLSEPCSPVDFTYPSTNGEVGISTTPTFTWNVSPTAGDALGMWLWDPVAGDDVDWDAPVSMGTTSWGPLGPLDSGHDYGLEVSVFEVKDLIGGGLPIMTVGGDEFKYGLMIEYMNEIEFTTVPEPATIALLGLGSLVLFRRKGKRK